MDNVQKFKLNTLTSIINRIVIMISGLILPRLILVNYGSEINGLVSSITQFLAIITFLDLGVGAVVQSSLYKPLSNQDYNKVSEILIAAKIYFRRIAYILLIYVVFLVLFYPIIVNNTSLNFISTALLIIAISISQFSQYYFGIINEFLLNADQKGYIQLGLEILVVILNLLVSIVLINLRAPIYIVKLFASLIFLIRPIFLSLYVRKNYSFDFNLKLNEDPLPQKWSGMGQHLAYSVQNSTDITVLTLFSTLSNVSIYSVYNLVTNAIKLLISSFTTSLQSFFGNLIAQNSIKELNEYFSKIEWILHNLIVFVYSMTAVLITPFVMLYTQGITDVNYHQPVFAIILVLARFVFSLRTPYQSLVFAAGHFKQTQMSSFIEAGLNIGFSVLLVSNFGITGVAFGTLIAVLYRIFYLSWYISKNIIYRPIGIFNKYIIIDTLTFIIITTLGTQLLQFSDVTTFVSWIGQALLIGIVALILMLLINLIFYRSIVIYMFRKTLKR